MGYVIAISQSKGGSSKTTTAVNLCGALLEKGFKAVVADMDSDKPDAVNWAKQSDHINFVVELFEEKPMDKMEVLRKNYDFIILDTPPSYMPAAFKAIMLSDLVILPCSPSFLDKNNLTEAISIPQMAQKAFRTLASNVKKDHALSLLLINELALSGQNFTTTISVTEEALASPFYGQWVGNYRPNCDNHQEFLALADEVIRAANLLNYPNFPNQETALS